MDWYVLKQRRYLGPWSEDKLRVELDAGRLHVEDFAVSQDCYDKGDPTALTLRHVLKIPLESRASPASGTAAPAVVPPLIPSPVESQTGLKVAEVFEEPEKQVEEAPPATVPVRHLGPTVEVLSTEVQTSELELPQGNALESSAEAGRRGAFAEEENTRLENPAPSTYRREAHTEEGVETPVESAHPAAPVRSGWRPPLPRSSLSVAALVILLGLGVVWKWTARPRGTEASGGLKRVETQKVSRPTEASSESGKRRSRSTASHALRLPTLPEAPSPAVVSQPAEEPAPPPMRTADVPPQDPGLESAPGAAAEAWPPASPEELRAGVVNPVPVAPVPPHPENTGEASEGPAPAAVDTQQQLVEEGLPLPVE